MAGYIGSNQPTNLSNTSADIDGTLTADGLVVEDADGATIRIQSSDTSVDGGSLGQLEFYSNDASTGGTGVKGKIQVTDTSSFGTAYEMNFFTGYVTGGAHAETKKMSIGPFGDISFYEDTGTTAKLFWDASEENLGIGTSSPASNLHVESTGSTGFRLIGGTTGANTIYMGDTASNSAGYIQYSNNSDYMRVAAGGAERMRIDSSGNVGIGTTNPSAKLHVRDAVDTNAASGTGVALFQGAASTYSGRIGLDATGMSIGTDNAARALMLVAGGSERARIDSSGNLMVGTTSTDLVNNNGIVAAAAGFLDVGRNSLVARFTRRSTDGSIVEFRKDGTTVGAITIASNAVQLVHTGVGIGVASDNLYPTNGSGASTDNVMDVGDASARFDDVYATNGTIQTSDQNEKQQIASLTDAEITAAKAISKLFKTFKWNDSVAEKGDAARTHTGVIAQEVEQAMTDAGLNAGDYAFFISTTWWETQTEVPAVEAVEAVEATYDEEGNVLTEAVEAVEGKEAYTRTDTYDTLEEAPEGATERNRKGIRYPQLLSFIGAATEQRLASIESRLDALESA